jgi:glycosyltransferase involved in cell wall biosynthesis
MNILQALFFPPEQPGGVSSMVPYIQEKFLQMNWKMDLFSLPKRIRGKGTDEFAFTTFDWTIYRGRPIVEKYMQTLKDYYWFAQMRLRNSSYDIIHAHHPIAALIMKRLFPDTPILMTVHSSYERELILNGRIEEGSPEHRFLTSLYHELEEQTDLIITVSQSFKSYISQFVERPEAVKVILNGFDQNRFKPVEHDNGVPQIVTLCRLVPAKGLDVLLEALSLLKKRGYAFVLHMIGDGPMRETLEKMAVELDIYDETIFYGYMLHPEELMPFFDLFVLPSRAEAFGNVFAEAALCRLALIGTNVGGIAEQIEDGVNGLLVPVDDVEALTQALEKMVKDDEFRRTMAKAAYERAKEQSSITRVIRELEEVYKSYKVS